MSVNGAQYAYDSSVNNNLNTQRASGMPSIGDNGSKLAVLSTNISVYSNEQRVGFIQDISPSESRSITPIQELGTEGVVQMVASNTNGGTLSCSRFAVYNASLFNALGLTGTGTFTKATDKAFGTTKYNYDGKEINQTNTNNTLSNPFKTLKDQRVPIEIKLSIRQPGRNAKPITQTYIDCWLTQYSKAVSSSTITITESCTISYSDVI